MLYEDVNIHVFIIFIKKYNLSFYYNITIYILLKTIHFF